MNGISSGFRLEKIGMQVCADLGPGLFGHRWSVQMLEQEPGQPIFEGVAEIVEVLDPAMDSRCDNISRLTDTIRLRGISHVFATDWIGDFRFVAVCDLRPSARSLVSLAAEAEFQSPDEESFWSIAATLFQRVDRLHRNGFVHGALSPATLKVDDGVLLVSDLWWMESTNGRPWSRSGQNSLLDQLPAGVREFASPEVLSGLGATKESDYYSMGAILHFVLAGFGPAPIDAESLTDSNNPHLQVFDRHSAPWQFVLSLLKTGPGERMNRPQVEAVLHPKMLSRVTIGFPDLLPFQLTSEYGPGLYGLRDHELVEMIDLHYSAGSIQMECRNQDAMHLSWFLIEGLLQSCGRTYMAVSDCPRFTERFDILPYSVVCMEDDWHFRTLSQAEFRSIEEDMIESIRRGTGRCVDYAQFLLGPFREWASVQQIRHVATVIPPVWTPGETSLMSERQLPQTARPVSALLQEFADHCVSPHHNVGLYAKEFARTKYQATQLLGVGRNWAALELVDGTILKISNRHRLLPEMGLRSFDMPFLQKRQWPRDQQQDILYVIQPRADVPVSPDQLRDFKSLLQSLDYRFVDTGSGHPGIYQGRVVLLDPLAVIGLRSVSELIGEIRDDDECPHCIDTCVSAFANTNFRAWRVIRVGGDSIALELADGNVLKVTNKASLPHDFGKRPFDLQPIQSGWAESLRPPRHALKGLKTRSMQTRRTILTDRIFYYVQPPVETPVTRLQLYAFCDRVRSLGYRMTDIDAGNLGIHQGNVVLIDLFAVKR